MMIQEKNEQLQAEKRRTESMKSKASTQHINDFRIGKISKSIYQNSLGLYPQIFFI